MNRFYRISAIVCLIIASPALAQEDAYHANLRAQLQAEYGITGGEWVIAENENGTISGRITSGNYPVTTSQLVGEAFSTALQLNINQRGNNPWDYFISFPTAQPLTQGDKVLLVLWVRGIQADRGSGLVNANFEMNSSMASLACLAGNKDESVTCLPRSTSTR